MKNKNAATVIGGILGFLVFFSVGYYLTSNFFGTGSDPEKEFLNEIKKSNETLLPMSLDESTILDSISSKGWGNVNFHISALVDIEEVLMDTVRKYFDPLVIQITSEQEEFEKFRDEDFTFVYVVNDQNGEIFHRVTVTPELYK